MNERGAQLKHGAILIAIIALGMTLSVWPTRGRISDLQEQLNRTFARLDQAPGDHDRLIAADSRLRKVSQRQAIEFSEVPQYSDIPSLMKMISNHMDTLPLTNNTVSSGVEAEIGGLQSLRLQIASEGEFEGIFELLCRLESLPRLVRIAEVSIAAPSGEEGMGSVKVEISLDTFYRQSHTSDDQENQASSP